MPCFMWRVCHQIPARLSYYIRLTNLILGLPVYVRFCSTVMAQTETARSVDNNLFALPPLSSTDFRNVKQNVTFKALKIPKETLQVLLLNGVKHRAYKRPKFNFVRNGEDKNCRYILLDPKEVDEFESWKSCPVLKQNNIEPKLTDYEVTLMYEDFTADEILRALLPPGVAVPTSFSRIGHIAHINLREEQLPHKNIIGQVMMDKTPSITTVVNKTNEISNQYRVFNMEVLAGEKNFVTMVNEHHCTFQLDFSKVYWNPRLSTEHERIVTKVKGQVLFDVFAGIGPFAVPAAKNGSQVYANDLNPDSYSWLKKNAKLNKVEKRMKCSNMDGRAFITSVVKDAILDYVQQDERDRPIRIHIIMNLPASAVEFLDAFKGLLCGHVPIRDQRVPHMSVHCYCFSNEQDVETDAHEMIEHHLGCTIKYPEIHNVRNVAPNKEMMCVSFEIPSNILWAEAGQEKYNYAKRSVTDDSSEGDGSNKRQK